MAWNIIKTNIKTGDTWALTGYQEYLVMLKDTATIYATMLIPANNASDQFSVKFITGANAQIEASRFNGTWAVTSGNYYAVLFGRFPA